MLVYQRGTPRRYVLFWNLLDAAGSEALKKPFRRPRTWGRHGDFHSIQPLAIPWPFLDATFGRAPFPPRKNMTHTQRINAIIIIVIMRTKHDDNSYTIYE